MRAHSWPAALLAAGCLTGAAAPAQSLAQSPSQAQVQTQVDEASGLSWRGELQSSWREQAVNTRGPLVAANRLAPGIAALPESTWVNRAELSGAWQGRGAAAPYSVATKLALEHSRAEHGGSTTQARTNEFAASADWGVWQASAGKKIVAWDVGYAWRPNDVVQQEQRRLLLPVTPEGRPVLMLEHFATESAATLVLVHPQRVRDAGDGHRGPDEAALAGRWYQRVGSADWHGFARLGEHTGTSLGAALAWVASDELELHASVRGLQRHDGLVNDAGAGEALLRSSPVRIATLGATQQWLLGGTWTGSEQQSLLAELWHDGTAPSNGDWAAWQQRIGGLQSIGAQPTLRTPAAANLAWQAGALGGSQATLITTNLRQDNLYLRASWQPAAWQPFGLGGSWALSADALYTPADRGHAVGAGLQWQGDRWRIDLAWRRYGGPADALYAQLPMRTSGVLAATFAL
jgi:hypothetical protein